MHNNQQHKKKKKRKRINTNTTNKKQKLGITVTVSKIDHDSILSSLRSIDWSDAKNTSRRNVIRTTDSATPRTAQGKPYCQSFIFGRNMKDPNGGMSWWSTEYPTQYEALKQLMVKYVPSFNFTHITLNRNLRCARHQDKGNLGPSFIVGFGPFKGGALIVEDEGGGRERVYNVKSQLVSFNGATQPHETKAYTGERFTIVYYTSTIKPSASGGGRQRNTIKPSDGMSNKFQEMKKALLSKKKKKRR